MSTIKLKLVEGDSYCQKGGTGFKLTMTTIDTHETLSTDAFKTIDQIATFTSILTEINEYLCKNDVNTT